MKAVLLTVFLSLGVLTAAHAYDNSVPCGDLIGKPEFWECIAGSNIAEDHSYVCSDLIGKPEFWDCLAKQDVIRKILCATEEGSSAPFCLAE